jgi:hemolysin activation/secretion protein
MADKGSTPRVGACRLASLLFTSVALALAPHAARAQTAPAAPPARKPVTMFIREYFVVGNTVLPEADVERAVYPYLGPDKSVADVEAARLALEKAIQGRGYKTVFVEAPPQSGAGGIIRLQVTQTPVGTVKLEGVKADGQAARQVLAALPALQAGQTPNLTDFSAELSALNSRTADRQVTPELTAGAAPDTVDVALKVEDKSALHGSLEVNNQYNPDTTPTRVAASLRYDNLWGLGHTLSGFYEVAPQNVKDAELYVLSYGLRLGGGLRLDVTGLQSNSDVATVGSTDVLGKGHSVEAVLTQALPSTSRLTQSVAFSVAWKDFDERVTFGSTASATPITYYPVGVAYVGAMRLPAADLSLNAALKFTFRGLGDGVAGFDNKRAGATGGFAYVHIDASWRQDLPWKAESFVRVSGQLASEPLISNEEFAAGGSGSVRGYLQSEAIGDDGAQGTFELRSPPLSILHWGPINEVRAISFVDAATVRVREPLADETSRFNLLGAGIGLRTRLKANLTGDVDLGFPLLDAGTTRAGQPRIQFRVSSGF